jgi:hypothetical protein
MYSLPDQSNVIFAEQINPTIFSVVRMELDDFLHPPFAHAQFVGGFLKFIIRGLQFCFP